MWRTPLTHWGRVTHICVSKLTIIGSENGLSSSAKAWWWNPMRVFSALLAHSEISRFNCTESWIEVIRHVSNAPVPSHFLNQCWNIGNWTLRNKLPWNLNRNSHLSIQENVFENVVGKLAAILSRSQYARYLYVESFLSSHTMLVDIFHTWKSWWRHQMELFPRYWPFVRGIHRSPVNSPHKGQWRGALMFSLICVWINGWVNNHEAGDLRRYRGHYDVIVMIKTALLHNKASAMRSQGIIRRSVHAQIQFNEEGYINWPKVRHPENTGFAVDICHYTLLF